MANKKSNFAVTSLCFYSLKILRMATLYFVFLSMSTSLSEKYISLFNREDFEKHLDADHRIEDYFHPDVLHLNWNKWEFPGMPFTIKFAHRQMKSKVLFMLRDQINVL